MFLCVVLLSTGFHQRGANVCAVCHFVPVGPRKALQAIPIDPDGSAHRTVDSLMAVMCMWSIVDGAEHGGSVCNSQLLGS